MAERDGDEVNVRFGAQIDDLKSKLGEVQGLFGELTSRFAAMAAVVAGGAAFKSFIDEANNLNIAAEKMSRTLGISATEAGILGVAIDDIGAKMGVAAGPETYTAAFLKFNRTLRTSSDELRKLGVDVDGLQSGQKTSNQVFQEALGIVGTYKTGVDQTQVAMKLFGRSVQEVQVLAQLNAKAIEDARQAAEDLNLTITAEGVKAAEDYRVAMDNVGDVLQGLKKSIGEAVMPMFSEMATQLASFGPTLIEGTRYAVDVFVEVWQSFRETVSSTLSAIGEIVGSFVDMFNDAFGTEAIGGMQIFRNALALVHAAALALSIGFQEVVNVIKTSILLTVSLFQSFAEVGQAALNLDFAAAKAAWQRGFAERAAILQAGIDNAVKIASKGAEDLQRALVDKPFEALKKGTAAGVSGTGGTKTNTIEDKGAAGIAAARAALAKAQNEADLALQREFLASAQAIYEDAYRQNLISTKEYFDAKLAITLQSTDAELAAKRRELEAVKKLEASTADPAQKIKFQTQEAGLLGQINALEAKRVEQIRASGQAYREAEQARADALARVATGAKAASGEGEVAAERQKLELLKSLRMISAEDAAQIERDLETRSYQIKRQALAEKQLLVRGDVQKQAELNAEIEAAEREHASRMVDINSQASQRSAQFSISAQQTVQSSFATMIDGLLAGVTKVSDVFRNFGISIANMFTNLIAQRFAERLFGEGSAGGNLVKKLIDPIGNAVDFILSEFLGLETAKTAAAAAGAAQRNGIEAASAATMVGIKGTETAAVATAEATKTATVVASATTRTTAEVTAASTSTAATAGSAIANIAAKAWEAAASVYAAIAAIPFVGPFLAPAAAIGASVAVLGFASRIVSSKGGEMTVPEDRMQLVHKDETILPADYAAGLRQIIKQGNAASFPTQLPASINDAARVGASTPSPDRVQSARQAMSRGGDVSFSVTAVDAAGVEKFFMRNGRKIAQAIQSQGRNFVQVKPT